MPIQLKNLGDHLSFSNGIVVLAIISCLLIILFKGDTHALIPLYAVGVFSAFCMSQLGMVFHWMRVKTRAWYLKAAINGLGFITTGTALLVIIESKIFRRCLVSYIICPVLLMMFYKIHQHYIWADRELAMTLTQAKDYLRQAEGIKQKSFYLLRVSIAVL